MYVVIYRASRARALAPTRLERIHAVRVSSASSHAQQLPPGSSSQLPAPLLQRPCSPVAPAPPTPVHSLVETSERSPRVHSRGPGTGPRPAPGLAWGFEKVLVPRWKVKVRTMVPGLRTSSAEEAYSWSKPGREELSRLKHLILSSEVVKQEEASPTTFPARGQCGVWRHCLFSGLRHRKPEQTATSPLQGQQSTAR